MEKNCFSRQSSALSSRRFANAESRRIGKWAPVAAYAPIEIWSIRKYMNIIIFHPLKNLKCLARGKIVAYRLCEEFNIHPCSEIFHFSKSKNPEISYKIVSYSFNHLRLCGSRFTLNLPSCTKCTPNALIPFHKEKWEKGKVGAMSYEACSCGRSSVVILVTYPLN